MMRQDCGWRKVERGFRRDRDRRADRPVTLPRVRALERFAGPRERERRFVLREVTFDVSVEAS